MDTTPRPGHAASTFRSTLRRGLGAGQAHAAGVAGGLTPVRSASEPTPHPHRNHAAHPANLPAATTTAYRYSFRDGQLIRL